MSDDRFNARQVFAAFVAGVCVGIGPVVTLLQKWSDIWETPTFTGLALSVIGGVIGAVFVPRPLRRRIEEALRIAEKREEQKI